MLRSLDDNVIIKLFQKQPMNRLTQLSVEAHLTKTRGAAGANVQFGDEGGT